MLPSMRQSKSGGYRGLCLRRNLLANVSIIIIVIVQYYHLYYAIVTMYLAKLVVGGSACTEFY